MPTFESDESEQITNDQQLSVIVVLKLRQVLAFWLLCIHLVLHHISCVTCKSRSGFGPVEEPPTQTNRKWSQ